MLLDDLQAITYPAGIKHVLVDPGADALRRKLLLDPLDKIDLESSARHEIDKAILVLLCIGSVLLFSLLGRAEEAIPEGAIQIAALPSSEQEAAQEERQSQSLRCRCLALERAVPSAKATC